MSGGNLHSAPNTTFLLQNKNIPCSSNLHHSLWVPHSSSPPNGSSSMVSFGKATGAETSHGEEGFDGGSFLRPGKKRRLSGDQVRGLEESFEIDNKLESERKVKLGNELGLEPRQVAIWFQNRKARCKSKNLEKDYDFLKSSFEKLEFEFEILVKENEKLKEQVLLLKDKLLISGDLEIELKEHVPRIVSENGSDPNSGVPPAMLECKIEDASSAKSDVLDSDSAHYATHSNSLVEPTTADSSNVFESDEDDDNFSRSFLPAAALPAYLSELEEGLFELGGSCIFGFQNEDHLFCLWP